jgi:biotin transport system ATP-binding protein
MPELFKARGLCHTFRDGAEGLADIDFSIADGEFVLVAGRNGSGKTLLARHLVGLSAPTAGELLFRGERLGKDKRALRSAVGYVFQDTDAQILGQTVAEDVAFGPANLRLSQREIERRTGEALKTARLEASGNRRPETLSGGEKRRLAIAGVLAAEPDCLILDEPFANLDLESIQDISRLLAELKARGTTLIVVTHELEKVFPLADRLIVLDHGRMRYDGAPDAPEPEFFAEHGLACPYEGFFPWAFRRAP